MPIIKSAQINMKQNHKAVLRPTRLILPLMALTAACHAQVFTFKPHDLILGFRKVAPFTENYDVVVNIGQVSNYTSMAVGSAITIPGFSASQLTPGSFTSLSNLSWSAFAAGGYAGQPNYMLWLTVPRTDINVQSQTPTGQASTGQQLVYSKMTSIPGNLGAIYISLNLGASNQFNTPTFVREPLATYGGHLLDTWIAGSTDPTQGTFNDTWPSSEPNNGNVENMTPSNFSSGVVRSDFYQVAPNSTNGPATYLGYFELNANGSMTFTRQNASSTPPPPPAPVLTIGRAGNVSTISFVSSNSSIYRLYFTNSAGLTSPVSNWPSMSTTITGDGSTQSFQDTTTDPNRFYKVQGH